MRFCRIRIHSFYFVVLFALILAMPLIMGCDYVKLLDYDDEDTYAEVDKGILSTMAPPTPSEIGNALNILKTSAPHQNAGEYIQAVSTIVGTMNLGVSSISNVNMSFSINEFVDSIYETLRLEGKAISKDSLKSIVIQALNAAIREVINYPGNRLDSNKAAFFALGERLVQNNIMQITDGMANDRLLDSGSFTILAVVINQAISVLINESIVEEITKTQDNPILIDYRTRFLPAGIPLSPGSLPYYVKQLLDSNSGFMNTKREIQDEIGRILRDKLTVNGKIVPEEIRKPEIFNAIQNSIKDLSLVVIDLVERESEYLDLTVDLTISLPHQGIVSVGWSS